MADGTGHHRYDSTIVSECLSRLHRSGAADAVLGALLHHVLPEYIITMSLALVLSLTAVKTLLSAKKKWQEENGAMVCAVARAVCWVTVRQESEAQQETAEALLHSVRPLAEQGSRPTSCPAGPGGDKVHWLHVCAVLTGLMSAC